MKPSRLTLVGLSLLVLAGAVAAWKQARVTAEKPVAGSPEDELEPRPRSKWFWESEDAAPAPDTPPPTPAPPTEQAFIIDGPDGDPLPGVTVSLIESPVLDARLSADDDVLSCDDLPHLVEIAATWRRDGVRAEVMAEGVTDEKGEVKLTASAKALMLVKLSRPGQPDFFALRFREGDRISYPDLSDPERPEVAVTDTAGEPVSARLTMLDLGTGRAIVERTGPDGVVTVPRGRTIWGIAEADGFFPQTFEFEGGLLRMPVTLSKVATVEIQAPTQLGGAKVKLGTRHSRHATLMDGKAVFANVRAGHVEASLDDAAYLGTAVGEVAEGSVLLLVLKPRRVSWVSLTVIDASGNPLSDVSATLTTPAEAVSGAATSEGERIELGPIGEGDALLRVTAPGFRPRSRPIALAGGTTEIEVVLDEAPALRGRVVDAAGQPVPDVLVQVRGEDVNDPEGAVTGSDGRFLVHVDEPGTWQLEASAESLFTRATVEVPGPEVELRLAPFGRAEVTVLLPPGYSPESLQVRLASGESAEPDVGMATETGEFLFEELAAGVHRLEVNDASGEEALLTHTETISVQPGQTTKLAVRLQPSASFHGRLVDEAGQPLEAIMLRFARPQGEPLELYTDADGLFVVPGHAPGTTLEPVLLDTGYSALKPSQVKVVGGTTPVTITAIRGRMVKGRVVSQAGAPVADFTVNGVETSAEDGRFEIGLGARRDLEVAVSGGPIVRVPVQERDDVGDIVVQEPIELSGRVVDESGQPMASVSLSSADFESWQTVTDGQGRFTVVAKKTSGRITIEGRHGELAAVTEVELGRGPVEIVLGPPTRIEGVVRGPGGRAVMTSVVVKSELEEELRLETDEQGRFALSLAQGRWMFATRLTGTSVAVLVKGRTQRVELGVPEEACALEVRSVPLPNEVWLVPAGVEWSPPHAETYDPYGPPIPPGVVALALSGNVFQARSVPCGAWRIAAPYSSTVVTQPVQLSSGTPGRVTLEAPPLSTLGGHEVIPMTYRLLKEPELPTPLVE